MSDKKERKVIEYKKYQQGDVVMLKVNDDYFEKNVRKGEESVSYNTQSHNNPILAFGEVTGHKHQIHMKDMLDKAEVTLHMGYSRTAGVNVPDAFEVREETVTLTHEEHAPLDLPPGKYMVKIVQEFNHITRRAQNVAD
jgi:hypothetical protein